MFQGAAQARGGSVRVMVTRCCGSVRRSAFASAGFRAAGHFELVEQPYQRAESAGVALAVGGAGRSACRGGFEAMLEFAKLAVERA
jgi:hypothetical protein